MSKSSRGNPWHDSRGRFCSGPSSEEIAEWLEENDVSEFGGSLDTKTLVKSISDNNNLRDAFEQRFGYSIKSERMCPRCHKARLVNGECPECHYPHDMGLQTIKWDYYTGDINEGLRIDPPEAKGYQAQLKRDVGSEVTVWNLSGAPFKGYISAVEKDSKGNDIYVVQSELGQIKCGNGLLDSWMTDDDINTDKVLADRLRSNNAHKYARSEILFIQNFGRTQQRCHASIVDKLPEKTSKWSNGYAKIADYEKDGKTFTVYKDRDDNGQFSYFAIEVL